MKKNMGNADRTIRVIAAIAIAVLFFTHVITGTFAIVLIVLASIFLLTSLVGFCPAYALFGINSCPSRR